MACLISKRKKEKSSVLKILKLDIRATKATCKSCSQLTRKTKQKLIIDFKIEKVNIQTCFYCKVLIGSTKDWFYIFQDIRYETS